jgi:hypothetical protein
MEGKRMTEVRRKPIETEDDDGITYISLSDYHTILDIMRCLLSTGVEASELIDHINDPTLLAELERK